MVAVLGGLQKYTDLIIFIVFYKHNNVQLLEIFKKDGSFTKEFEKHCIAQSFKLLYNIALNEYATIHSLSDELVKCFQLLAFMNNIAVNI